MEKMKIFGILAIALFAFAGMAIAAGTNPATAVSANSAGILADGQVIGNPIAVENPGADAFVANIFAEPQNPPIRDFVQNMRAGDIADTGDLHVRLSQVGSRNNVRYAIVDIMDGNDNLLAQTTINSGSTYTFVSEQLNKRLRISVSQINLQRNSARLNMVESTLHADAQRLEVDSDLGTGLHVIRLISVDRDTGEAEMEIRSENGRERLETIHVMPGTSFYYRDYRANIRLRINVYYGSREGNAGSRWIFVGTRENLITQPRDIDVGESFRTAHFSVRLADVDVARGENNEHAAILDILNGRGELVAQTTVNPGSGYVFTSHNQDEPIYRLYVRVYETAPGFNLEDKWARISVTEIRG